MARRRWRRWSVVAAIVAAIAALAAPFVVERRVSYYTDGERVQLPASLARSSVREVLWEPPRGLDGVNDPELDDYEPCISPHGDLLVFTRGRPGEDADLWLAVPGPAGWRDPRPIEEIDTEADELGAAFSADGRWLFFYSDREGGLGGHDIWASERREDGFGAPVNLGEAVNGPWNELSPAPAPDGEQLYFTSDRRAGERGAAPWRGTMRARLRAADYDIWVAARGAAADGAGDDVGSGDEPGGDPAADVAAPAPAFEPARPLVLLNHAGSAEGAVAVSPGRDFLYFASNRRGGEGGFDLYRLRLTGGEPAGPAEGLGPIVNSTADELDPALAGSGFELYFARAREGQEDIFMTRSREVFVIRESEGPYWSIAAVLAFLADLIQRIPPGLFILLVYLLLALLFLLLFRRRLGTLHLLARCVLIAILIHILMALWMNRHRVERIVLEVLAEEEYDAFEVAIEGMPEEAVVAAIRETVAEAESERAPVLEPAAEPQPRPRSDDVAPAPPIELPPAEPVAAMELAELEETAAPPPETAALEPSALPEGEAPALEEAARPSPAVEPRVLEAPAEREDRSAELAVRPRERDASDRADVEAVLPELSAPAAAPVEERSLSETPALPDAVSEVALPDPELPGAALPELDAAAPPPTADVAVERSGPRPAPEPGPEVEAPALRARGPAPRRIAGRTPAPKPAEAEVDVAAPAGAAPVPAISTRDAPPRPAPASIALRAPADVEPAPALPRPTADAPPLAPAPEPRVVTGAVPRQPEERPPALAARRGPSLPPRGRPARSGATPRAAPPIELALDLAGEATRPPAPRTEPLSPSPRPAEDLAAKIAPIEPAGADEVDVVATVAKPSEAASSFVPRIYRLRRREAREEALRRGGGSERTERAVEAGLAWLARHQSPDGRWSLEDYAAHLPDASPRDLFHPDWNGRGRTSSRGGSRRAANGDTAATGLALLAFLGHGDAHVAGGPYREAVDRGLRWLLRQQRRTGDLRGGGNLYMHAIAAFAICEAYAFTRDPGLRGPAQRAIDFTVWSQHPQLGGWRYDPFPDGRDVDTSVFGWMLMALKSGKLGGLEVDERCLDLAAGYLASARMPDRPGEFAYQPGSSRTSIAMTAQGLFSLHIIADTLLDAEERRSPGLLALRRAAVDFVLRNPPRARDMDGVNFYYWYYATLALFQEGGEPWQAWNRRLSELLVAQQVGEKHGTAHGSWDPRGTRAETGGRVYSTALSILCLEVYYRYAPLGEEPQGE